MAKKKVSSKEATQKSAKRVSFADDTILIILGGSALIMILTIALLK